MSKKVSLTISIWLAFVMLLSACATPTPTQAPVATQPPPATAAPAATQAPTAVPTKEYPKPGAAGHLVLATTTSTQDSGLLDYLLPMFEQEAGVIVDVIAVGTGQALTIGQDGNADVLLVHSRAKEDEFMTNGHGVRREDVMYNDYLIVGPESDPAGIKGMTSAVDAFKTIAEKQAIFISRGDDSGTHTKEKSIWAKAEITPEGNWYVSAGQGMGEVLTMANEQQGYTLSDRATYLARTKEGLELVVLVEGDKALFNPYGVIAVDPKKNPNIQGEMAQKFIDWIISVPVQELIGEFGKEDFGQSLFVPDSQPWRDSQVPPTEAPAAVVYALKITGKVAQEMGWTEDEIKAMTSISVQSTNKKGETATYTGVLLSDLLKLAVPDSGATTLVFVADDGFTAEVSLADVMACADCILSFRDQGGFSIVMPGFPGSAQVKGVVEIQVK